MIIVCNSVIDQCMYRTHLNYTFDVTMTFRVVDWSQFGCSFAVLVVALEDTTGTFTLASNNSTHVSFILTGIFGVKDDIT